MMREWPYAVLNQDALGCTSPPTSRFPSSFALISLISQIPNTLKCWFTLFRHKTISVANLHNFEASKCVSVQMMTNIRNGYYTHWSMRFEPEFMKIYLWRENLHLWKIFLLGTFERWSPIKRIWRSTLDDGFRSGPLDEFSREKKLYFFLFYHFSFSADMPVIVMGRAEKNWEKRWVAP